MFTRKQKSEIKEIIKEHDKKIIVQIIENCFKEVFQFEDFVPELTINDKSDYYVSIVVTLVKKVDDITEISIAKTKIFKDLADLIVNIESFKNWLKKHFTIGDDEIGIEKSEGNSK